MIRHCVLWTLKENAEGTSKEENARKVISALRELPHSIGEIRHCEVGLNKTGSPDAYDIGLCMEFNTMADLEIYQKHPAHLRFVEFIRKVREKRAVVDFEI
jgi:hypothetical protein